MNIKNFLAKLLLMALFASFQNIAGQELGVVFDNTLIAPPTSGTPTTGTLDFITPCSDFYVKEGKVWVKIDLGEQYGFGSGSAGLLFDIDVNLDLTLETSSGANPTIGFDVTLSNQNPEALVYLDLNQYLDNTNTVTGLSFQSESVNSIKATINSVIDNNSAIDLQANLGIGLYYELTYGIDVSNNVVSLTSHGVISGGKGVSLEWSDTCDAPNYEVQLLRLFNKDENLVADERNIRTNVDWDKALSFQTYSPERQILLTIGEGQGFYVWRVRPLGTFYKNGIGNDQNWGTWNTSVYGSNEYEFLDPTGNVEAFFFEDPDDNINYQYSRVFTEGNKVSEQATYATTLNQVKQTQRYFPSKDYKIVSQTVLDKSGRPTLTTLPVPVEGQRIEKYQNNFVTTNDELYRAKHFDSVTNYAQPSIIDATGAFAYYSSLNTDKRIPNSEGYPFTRVIFSNDGTDRVVEQSGVGRTHMIGDQAVGQGRTVRTLYGTPTEEELVALFGDEAPDPEQVAKVITIDPNNTKSIAYITKEGNTIATGLTFSEDQAILDKIDTGAVIFGRTDKISNNTAAQNGFKASKRVTILEDATEIDISYTIAKPVLEGLCNNLELEMDYTLNIQIFDVDSGTVIQEFTQTSIAEALTDPSDEEITIEFGTVSLDAGTYYIQKNLEPSDDITARLVISSENNRKLIEPYFEWLVDALGEIDCEEEMQYLYNDIFFYGQKVYQQQLAQNDGLLQFDCAECSGIEYQFLSKDTNDPDAPEEFLDFYTSNEGLYSMDIVYVDSNGDFATIDYSQTSNLGNIKPVEVRFTTPCCQFDIPIVFTPPFRKPTPEALQEYVSSGNVVDNSTDYFNETLLSGESTISHLVPNYDFLTDLDNNFEYAQSGTSVNILNKEAYPLDFEGYAISMLYECKSTIDGTYTLDNAKEEIYKAMRGWHRPGLLNQMVYHMATDDYGSAGCSNRADGSDGNSGGGAGTGGGQNTPENGYHVCDIETSSVKLDGAQYSIDDLVRCWEPLVIELVNKLCVEQYEADIDQNSNVAKNVDDQDPDAVNETVKSIKSWILRWISRGKIKRKLRKKNASNTGDIADEVEKLNGNLVKTFLDCTGYAFADILDPAVRNTNYSEFTTDFEGTVSNGEYNHERLLNNGQGENWQYFSIDPNSSLGAYVTPPSDPEIETTNILKDIFPNIEDPVYAFKYFAYAPGTYPNLEVETCYRDPNICINDNGTPTDTSDDFEEPCCGGTLADPIPCNFCGIGYITCPYTKESWSCNQRFTFYDLIKNYEEVVEPEGIAVTCDNYYEATSYYSNPDFERLLEEDGSNAGDFTLVFIDSNIPVDALADFPYLSDVLITEYLQNNISEFTPVQLNDINGSPQSNGVSIIENDAYAMMEECTSNCEQRRDEFREELIKAFTDRCYVFDKCKVDPNDNIIPEEDIELMVDQMVMQCQSQCTISSYACADEGCRLPTKSPYEYGGSPETSNDFNTSYIDFGVSGPIVTGFSTRENQTLHVIDGNSGQIVDTGETVSTQNVSSTGTLYKYSYISSPSVWDMRRSLTYAEYSRWVQAMEWDILLDVPSKCDANGIYNESLTYDSNGLPNEPVYVLDEDGNWVVQSFVIAPSPYVSSNNPNGPGDTFLERDEYIKTNTTPASPNDPSFTEPITSPSVGVKVEVNNN